MIICWCGIKFYGETMMHDAIHHWHYHQELYRKMGVLVEPSIRQAREQLRLEYEGEYTQTQAFHIVKENTGDESGTPLSSLYADYSIPDQLRPKRYT